MSNTEGLVHQAVLAHALARPHAPALVMTEPGQRHVLETVSYATLVAAAWTYATQLRELGVRAGDIVPIWVPRSPRLAALELGVLLCGGAYANLDMRWPEARRRAALDLIGSRVLVTSERPEAADQSVLVIPYEPLHRVAARAGSAMVPVPVDPKDPAAVFFTSGTTGTPKGVVVPHCAMTRLFGTGRLPGFGPAHCTPQAAPAPWDMYSFELWGQLTTGGAVAPVAEDHLLPERLAELIAAASVDTLWLTTSLFNLFVDEQVSCFRGLTTVYVGGERLSPHHVRAFIQAHPDIEIRNGYGPAESSMLTTTHVIRSTDCDLESGIPIGQPVPGTRVELLGPDDLPCPVGEIGEIVIAGHGLAVGYLGQPDLTAERFPILQTGGGSATRFYRTGDRGVVDTDGVLHYRGRRDRQVKISGNRVELAELEVLARQVPGVRDCVAIPVCDDHGTVLRLALLYTAEDTAPGGDVLGVRHALRQTLPGEHVPSVVRALERFPTTANGKVDVAALEGLVRNPLKGQGQ